MLDAQKEKESGTAYIEDEVRIYRRCAFDSERFCNKTCVSLENVIRGDTDGTILYRGLYCMRGDFKIKSIYA